jgi:hypothetical protein
MGQWDQRVGGRVEIARLLGVPTDQVDEIARGDPSFPKPTGVLGAEPIWRRKDVERWLRKVGRRET